MGIVGYTNTAGTGWREDGEILLKHFIEGKFYDHCSRSRLGRGASTFVPMDIRIALFNSPLHVQNTPSYHLLIVILVIIVIISACPYPKVTAGKRPEAVNYEKDLCILSEHF